MADTVLATGLAFPEGPAIDRDGVLHVVEIAGQRVTKVHADGTTELFADTGGGPNGSNFGPDGNLYVCNNGGRWPLDVPSTADAPTPPEGPGSIQRILPDGTVEDVVTEIDGRPLASDVAGGETLCKKDEAGLPGGGGHEICGAALAFQLVGFGKFTEFVNAPGMDTLMLGEACDSGTPPSCVFQTDPPVKSLAMNFLRGGNALNEGPRRLGMLIVDSTGLDTADPNSSTEINVQGKAAGAKLQLREFPLEEGQTEIVAAIPVPEPGRFVQLLSGVLALAGLGRLRKQRQQRT